MEILTRRSFTSNPHSVHTSRSIPLPSPSEEDLAETVMLEPTEEELMDLDGDGVETLVMEMAALEALFEAIRGEGLPDRAVALCRQALEAQSSEPRTLEQHIVRAALIRATSEAFAFTTVLPKTTTRPSWVTFVYETIGMAWLRWLMSGDTSAIGLMARIRAAEPDTGHVPDGAIELMSLAEWGAAVEALAVGDEANAKRHFERATEIGAQVGSDSNPSINWTYAASFFRP